MDEVERKENTKKYRPGCMDICVACCTEISDMSTEDTKLQNGKKYRMKER
jgi:hypothetical protein